jgi:cytochrome c peroxidase
MHLLLALLSLISVARAQDTDRNLSQYIMMMNLKGLPAPTMKNEALYQLGLRLFYDKQLSGKENISCHSCHALGGHSGDTLPLGVGEGADGLGDKRIQNQGALLARHTPALYNLGLAGVGSFFWDGRVRRHAQGGLLTPEPDLNGPNPKLKEIATTLNGSLLAAQSLFPMANAEEMLGQGSTLSNIEAWESIMNRLFTGRLGASYQRFFREAFPGVTNFNIGHAGLAIAELERHHFLANNTPWDQFLRGNKKFMSERMKRGAVVFLGKGSCTNCHMGDHFSSFGFQNIGIPQIGPGKTNGDDKGLAEFTGVQSHRYAFRVTPLRNVALTAPYMHSGAFSNMWQVIEHYNMPQQTLKTFTWNSRHPRYRENLVLDTNFARNSDRLAMLAMNLPRNLSLTQDEKTDLYCFLMVGLTDLKNQQDLVTKGVLDEIDDCSPRIAGKSF